MAYLKNKHLANIKKWNIDLSKMKDGVYDDSIEVPKDIKEFKGFDELFGFEIKEVKGSLNFSRCTSLTSVSNLPSHINISLFLNHCKSLTSVSNLPKKIGWSFVFSHCTSLTSISNLPDYVGGYFSFYGCISLTSISKMPSVVQANIYTEDCPFFEGMNENQIRKKYNMDDASNIFQI